MVSLNFKSSGVLPSGFEVEFGILKNRHLVELQKKRKKGTEQKVLIEVLAEITHRIGETTKVTSKEIESLTPIDFKQLLCLIRQNTFDYPEEIEQPLSYEVENGKFDTFVIKEEIKDGEFPFQVGKLAYKNGYSVNGDKVNTVLKKYEDLDRDYIVTLKATKRRKAMKIRMTAPKIGSYLKAQDDSIIAVLNQRAPSIEKEKGWFRVNIADLPMNTSTLLMKSIEEFEGAVHTQTKFKHPKDDAITVIDFTDYPEFLLGKS